MTGRQPKAIDASSAQIGTEFLPPKRPDRGLSAPQKSFKAL